MALARTTEGTVHLSDLAGRIGLSPSRLTHLFTRREGIPFKRWLLWDRLLRTVDHLAAGVDLTTAAHTAGFADSAHLSRNFRAHFGIAASRIFRSRSVQVSRCPIH
jgi:AraC-like DNA-binding protein